MHLQQYAIFAYLDFIILFVLTLKRLGFQNYFTVLFCLFVFSDLVIQIDPPQQDSLVFQDVLRVLFFIVINHFEPLAKGLRAMASSGKFDVQVYIIALDADGLPDEGLNSLEILNLKQQIQILLVQINIAWLHLNGQLHHHGCFTVFLVFIKC